MIRRGRWMVALDDVLQEFFEYFVFHNDILDLFGGECRCRCLLRSRCGTALFIMRIHRTARLEFLITFRTV